MARVGFENHYQTKLAAWKYHGFIYRSKLLFDITPLKGKMILEAELRIKRITSETSGALKVKRHSHGYPLPHYLAKLESIQISKPPGR